MEEIIFTKITITELLQEIGLLIDRKLEAGLQQSNQLQPEYISRKEVSLLLKISLPTLNDWTKQDLLKAYKIGNRVLYKSEEVKESVEKLISNKHKKGGLQNA